ncbi:hypothetical protein CDL12_17724 [Handroanthus impetiginosus]|uniref:Uncharacterized protein n=1 Tax=Handroanthus impetiginosus TaxID=429701 RepID=A0A2G9GXF7_9LAMI|nr:hypothetical protein CDL12_17724 [Handroanthus impetiginosus]
MVFAPRIDDPRSGRFSRCSTDIFTINGPCTNPIICYLYLYRSGNDGWIPIDVTISGHAMPATFFYNVPIPGDTWFGYNRCLRANSSSLAVK